jgi:hypothetical protein
MSCGGAHDWRPDAAERDRRNVAFGLLARASGATMET